ncbi:MAG: phosphoribosylformylglycinamidine cyclo-ligase [Pirellulaceae bacterium]
MGKATYRDAGVDLDVYEESMARLPRLMHRTFSPRVIKLDGGFAGLFRLDFANQIFKRSYEDPVLVSCTDGVGTKLKVARLTEKHDTVGIDLVAMSVNDALCCGAEPLFFLDYVAMSHDDPTLLEQIVSGISDGCIEADCALLGGETAIMHDMYARGDYDLAGFCVGVVERKHVIDGKAIEPGDVVIGIASSGLHSNGYSLVRRVVFDMAGLGVNDVVPELGQTVGASLLTPTRIYARPVRQLLSHYKRKNVVKGIAHITGGGLFDNLVRVVPDRIRIEVQPKSWDMPPVFEWLQRLGDIDDEEMFRVFNMGIGMALVVRPFFADSVQRMLHEAGFPNWRIGQAAAGGKEVVWTR